MSPESTTPQITNHQKRGRESYEKGYAFEDRVAEAYRLLGYRVEHGRLFSGRQVDLFLELILGDLQVRRAVECKVGEVSAEDLDKFAIKLGLVQREYPDARGTIVGGLSFTDQVRAHAVAAGIQLTLYRDLSAQILDGPSYAQALIREAERNERYRPALFVESLIAYDSTGAGNKAFEVLDQWLQDGRWNQFTLLGDVGTGKSFLCRMIALRLAREYLKQPTERPLPLLVDLRNADRQFSLEGLILTHFASHGLSRATFDIFDFLLSEGRMVLILDGFDEMASKVTPTVTTRNFHELARCVKRNAKVLLTCRTHYFRSRTEEEEVVLGGPASGSSEVARDLYWDLISRSGSQIEEYVHKACPERGSAVLGKIRDIYNLTELSQRPLLLEMIVKSIDRLTTVEVNSAQLYEIFTAAWIQRDRWRDVMAPEEKLRFLTGLARSLWDQEKTNVDYRKLQEYVGAQLAALIDEPQRLTELDGEIRTASFLVRDDRGRYGFAHSSYAEYFLARDLANHVSAGDLGGLAVRRLTNEVIDFLLCMVDRTALEETLSAVLLQGYKPLLSENALVVLYRLRRNLLIEEKERGSDTSQLRVEMPSGAHLEGARLAQVSLEGAILHGAHLDGADLRQCLAGGIDLTSSSLRKASASKGDLHGATLRKVDATEATLSEVNFQGADVDECNFTRADISRSMFGVKSFSGALFSGIKAESAILPPGAESVISGLPTPAPTQAAQWDKEQLLVRVFRVAKRYASIHGAGAEAEDVASDVVVYLMSNPIQMARVPQVGDKLDGFARMLAWRRLITLRHGELVEALRDEDGEKGKEGGTGTREDADGQHDIELFEDHLGPSEEALPSEEAFADGGIPLDEIHPALAVDERTEENVELLDVLGKSLSEEALRMLVARYVDQQSVEEIAESENLTVVQVVRRLNMARELARRALRPL
jgi:DNA-directed RNA polymerase specialized sigma24 family protein